MKKEYITDYKGFITDWRERYIEVPKDIRRGKIWKAIDITIPDPWSENSIYSIKQRSINSFWSLIMVKKSIDISSTKNY